MCIHGHSCYKSTKVAFALLASSSRENAPRCYFSFFLSLLRVIEKWRRRESQQESVCVMSEIKNARVCSRKKFWVVSSPRVDDAAPFFLVGRAMRMRPLKGGFLCSHAKLIITIFHPSWSCTRQVCNLNDLDTWWRMLPIWLEFLK